MLRMDVINLLIDRRGYKSYLEIGFANGDCYDNIKCEFKTSTDPDTNTRSIFHLPSDEFFEQNKGTFSLIFIDGLHEAKQVYKDITNALNVLEPGGTIVCHDMNPQGFQEQFVPRQIKRWNGDCWKAFLALRHERDDLEMFVLDMDEGTGIIVKGKQEKLILDCEVSYDNFVKNRVEWLNLKPVEYLLEWLDKK